MCSQQPWQIKKVMRLRKPRRRIKNTISKFSFLIYQLLMVVHLGDIYTGFPRFPASKRVYLSVIYFLSFLSQFLAKTIHLQEAIQNISITGIDRNKSFSHHRRQSAFSVIKRIVIVIVLGWTIYQPPDYEQLLSTDINQLEVLYFLLYNIFLKKTSSGRRELLDLVFLIKFESRFQKEKQQR